MGRKGRNRGGTTPVDVEAGAFAQTARHPNNIEEARQHQAAPAKEETAVKTDEQDEDQGKGEQKAAPAKEPRQKAGLFTRAKAAITTGFCEHCQAPNVEDPKNTHECARCRTKPLPHILKHQEEKRRQAAKDKAEEQAASRKKKG